MAANTQRSGTKRSTNARAKAEEERGPQAGEERFAIHEQPLARVEQRPQHDHAQLEAEHVAFDGEPQQQQQQRERRRRHREERRRQGGGTGGRCRRSRYRHRRRHRAQEPHAAQDRARREDAALDRQEPVRIIDAKSIAKSVGHASKQFAKTSKGVSKDLERAGDQAERIGKILD